MPDEAEQAPATETPDTPAPEAASSEETPAAESTDSTPAATDYQQRYESLVPEYTRGQQLLAAARGEHGPEAQINALRQFGVDAELDGGEEQSDDDEWFDPEEEIRTIKQELAEERQSRENEKFQALEERFIDETLKGIESEEGVNLSDKQTRIVVNDALANRDPETGQPNLKGAFDDLMGIKSEARDEYLASKKNAPRAPVGAAGEDKIDFSDPEAARKWMVEDLEANMAREES